MRQLSILAAAIALAACGSEKSGRFETPDGQKGTFTADTSDGEGSFSIKTQDGEFHAQSGADVKARLPSGFTVYPGAEVVTNTVMKSNQGSNVAVIMSSRDSKDKVVAFYRKQAEAAGVDIKTEIKSGEMTLISGEASSGLIFSLNTTAGDDGVTGIQLGFTQPAGG